jgi:hypothetical protein
MFSFLYDLFVNWVTSLAAVFQPRRTPGSSLMDSHMSVALAKEYVDEFSADEIPTIEEELNQARQNLQDSQEKEKFVGMRVYKYRAALEDQAGHLREQEAKLLTDVVDEEEAATTKADLESRLKKWGEDEVALNSIDLTHRKIVIRCEQMRREIIKLERKREHLYQLKGECDEFLEAVEEVDDASGSGELSTLRPDAEEAKSAPIN